MKKRTRLIILIVILFIVAHFTFSSSRSTQNSLLTDRLTVYIYQPAIKVFKGVTGFFSDLVNQYILLVQAQKENKILSEAVHNLKIRNRSLQLLLNQKNDQGKVENKFSYLGKRFKRVRILGFDPFAQSKTMWIDTGMKDGIQVNMVVMSGDGLVGRVIQVFDKSSKVLLLIDSYFSVDSINERSGLRSVVRGMRGDELEATRLPYLSQVEYLERGHEMKKGDVLVTSGLSGLYPEGIPIGKVVDVKEVDAKFFDKSLVVPAVDFLKLKWLYVLSNELVSRD